jgi:hypothetical protein
MKNKHKINKKLFDHRCSGGARNFFWGGPRNNYNITIKYKNLSYNKNKVNYKKFN